MSIVIGKANATIKVTPYNVTYDATAHTAAATITGVGSDTAAIGTSITLSGTTHTTAGTYSTDSWSFAGGTNYNSIAATTITDTIGKATSTTTTVGAAPFTYDSTTHSGGSGTVIGVGGLSTGATSVTYTGDQVDAGSYSVTAHYAGDANHLASDGAAVSIVINKANATVVVAPYNVTYDAAAHTATATITGVGTDTAAAGSSITLSGTTHTAAGTYSTDSWSFAGGTNYNSIAATTITDTIAKATPTVTWATPASITYGTALGSAQLDATASVPGSFTYSPPAGTILPGGPNQPLSATFTPTDTANYNGASGSTTINVLARTSGFTGLSEPIINYGTATTTLSGVILAGTLVPSGNVAITLGGVTQNAAINASTGAFSTAFTTSTLGVAGSAYTISYAYAGNASFSPVSDNGQELTVNQATPTLVVTGATATYDATPHPATFTITGVNGDNLTSLVTLTYNGSPTLPFNAGTYPVLASFAGNTNYLPVSNSSQTVVIGASATTTVLASSANPASAGQSVTFTAIVSPVVPGGGTPTGSVKFQNGSTVLGTVPLSIVGGQVVASLTTAFTTAGAFTISAAYGNTDGNYTASSSSLVQNVQIVQTPGVYVSGTTLYVVGANTSDYAAISPAGPMNDGSTGLSVNSTLNGVWSSKTFTQPFTAIVIVGANGNDNFQLAGSLTLPTNVTEGNGNSYLQLGGGNDTVTLGTGSDQVFGGNGNKTITSSDAAGTSGYIALGNGNNNISLGDGNDQVVLGSGNNTVTAGNGNDSVTTSGSGSNRITLGNGNDYVRTGNGADTIALGSGNDNIQTGNGNKSITAGNGNDYVSAGSGNNVVTLGNGNDNVQLGGGNNTVILGNGNDFVYSGDGNNDVTVGNGNDNIQLGNGSNVVVEGNGNDYVSAGNGANLVIGGLGQHTIQLGNGNNILVDGSASVANTGDSLRQILSDWNASPSVSVNTRLKVAYNVSHPNYLSAGIRRDWFFYGAPTTSNKKSTDRLN